MVAMRFRDRDDAGRWLAARVRELDLDDPVVLALPRGGVPVAVQVARALGAPLDVILVRKLGVPAQPELAMGALGEEGVRVLDRDLVSRAGVRSDQLSEVEEREREELARRARAYRGDREPLAIAGRTVVIVDDGLATGASARAAIEVARARGAARVVLAVPVAPPETVAALRADADDVVSVETPSTMAAIGQWYDDFSQTSDAEVVAHLEGQQP
jgi:predicted phosphoribosyltransferase